MCADVRRIGQECSASFVVCVEGSECRGGRCWRLLVERGRKCGQDVGKCARGLVCAGREGRMRCEKPLRVGETCGFDPYKVCGKEAKCRGGMCFGADVGQGGKCGGRGVRCAKGLACAAGRCWKAARIGEACGRGVAVCRRGVKCVEGVCTAPVSGLGEECNVVGTVCVGGACVGRKGRRRCARPVVEGGWCDVDAWRVCGKSLICGYGRCRLVVGKGRVCGRARICGFGLRCVKRFVKWFREGDAVYRDVVKICMKSKFFR